MIPVMSRMWMPLMSYGRSALVTARPKAGSLVLTGYSPTITTVESVSPGVGALTISGYAPTAGVNTPVSSGVGTLTITGQAPSISAEDLYPCGITPVLWFDASDNDTLSVVSGNVDSITCKITSTTWTAPASANRPPLTTIGDFNYQCLDFHNDGDNKYLTGSAITVPVPGAIFFVAYWEGASAYRCMGLQCANADDSVQGGTGQSLAFIFSDNSGFISRSLQVWSNDTATLNVYTIPSNNSAVFCIDVQSTTGTDCKLYWDNTEVTDYYTAGSTFDSSFPFITLGSTDTLYLSKGYIGEVIAFGGALSTTQRECISDYLSTKWIV